MKKNNGSPEAKKVPERKPDTRARNFAYVVYPDSLPEHWKDLLSDLHVPLFISPLHDQDKNATGEPKKPHYHLVLMFEGKKSQEQIIELLKPLNGPPSVQVIQDIRAYARYLCHLDNPEKAQYKVEDVICLSSADYSFAIGLPTDRVKVVREMQEWVDDNDVEYLSDLFQYARQFNEEWFRALVDTSTLVMDKYIKSKTFKTDREQQKREQEAFNAKRGLM